MATEKGPSIRSLASLQKIAEGREAEIYAWEPGLILKLYRDEQKTGSRETEWLAMTAVHEAGGPSPLATTRVDIEGRPGLLMERIDRADLLTEIGRAPWKVLSVGGVMGRTHARVNQTKAPQQLGSLKDYLRERIESPLVPTDLRQAGIAALTALPEGDRLCHGDFHPGNILRGQHGGTVIDWSNATAGDAAADVAQTLLILSIGEPPPGSPPVIHRLHRVGRAIIRSRYLAAYAKLHPIDEGRTAQWAVPLRIARLSHGIDEERARLLTRIDQS